MCISLSLLVHSLSTASPMQCLLVAAGVIGYREAPTLNLQGRICMTQRWSRRMRTIKVPTAATAEEVIQKLLGANVYTQTHSGRRVLVDKAAGHICLQAGNTNRRQQLLGSEDSLGRQQGAEDAEWPSLARVKGTRQPWLATSLEEWKLQTETRSRQGLHQACLREGKPKEKPGLKGMPSWALTPKAENSGPCGVCYPQNRLFTHLRHYGRATIFGTVWCCPSGS